MSPRPHTVVTFAVDAPSSAIVEPPTHIREDGFATGTRPPAQWLNYLFRDLGLWVNRLRGPSRSRWTRTANPGVNLIAAAVDTVTADAGLANPIRRLVAIDDSGLNVVSASVRGDAWTALVMEPTASIGGPKCICASTSGWLVGGFLPFSTDGGIWSTPYDPDVASAIRDDSNTWVSHTLPASTTIVKAIASGASGSVACTDTKILYLVALTTWANASIGGTISGNVLDVCDTQSAWLAVTSNGQMLRAASPAATWTLATTLPAADWRLASNGLGTVVAYRYDTGGSDWYVSTDYGLTWGVLAPPPNVSTVRRLRYVDGTWFCSSTDYPFFSESNDLASWNRIAVPHATGGASHRIDDVALVDEGIVAVGQAHWLLSARGELVAQGPWSPAGSSLAIADAGYLQGIPIAPIAPSSGQVLAFNSTTGQWEPAAGGGGSLPAGTNGGVLRYASGAWASTGAGTAGQPLVSNGAAAAAFASTTLPLTQRASDAANNAVSVGASVEHQSSSAGAVGIGVRIEMRVTNDGSSINPIAAIDAVATNVAADSEHGVVDVIVSDGGVLSSRSARFWPAGVALGGVTAAVPTDAGVSLAWASRSIVLRDSAGGAWLDVWRVDGGNCWVFGSSNGTHSGGTYLQAPSNGEISLRRASTNHLFVNGGTGAMTIGTTSHATTLQGTTMVLSASTSLTIQAAPIAIIDDATNAGVTTMLTLRHTTTGAPAAGIGTRISLQTEDAAGNTEDAVYLDGVLTNAGNGTEASAFDVYTRTGGAALARVARFASTEIELDTKVSFAKAVRSVALTVSGTAHTLALTDAGRIRLTNTAARTVTLPASGAVALGDAGLEFVIHDAARTADSAAITITAPSGVTLNGVAASSVTLDAKGGAVVLRVVGANEWETVGL